MMRQGVFPFNRDKHGKYLSGSRLSLFPDAIVPEGIVPGSREHALLLFYGCGMDSMKLADHVYKGVRGIFTEVGFDRLHELTEPQIAGLLSRHHQPSILDTYLAGEPIMGDPIRVILENSKRLHRDYHDDPRELVADTIAETRERMEDFFQYGEGKSALLLKNYNRFGISNFNVNELPVKVDRHIKRISIGCGVVTLPREIEQLTRGRGDKLVRVLEDLYLRVTRTELISGIDLDDALWAIGRYLCKFNDAIMCHSQCLIGCDTRPPSDNGAIYFQFREDKRWNQDNLFTHALRVRKADKKAGKK